jgi:uncharacterized repeat protein (TIGR01451 family)
MIRCSIFRFPLAIAISAAALSASQASAQGLESMVAFKVVETAEDGAEQLIERDTVLPGETIEYALTHANTTEADLNGLSIVGPVPAGTTLNLGHEFSSLPAALEIQADLDPEIEGLEWSTLPAVRTVIDENGNSIEEPVPADAIAAIRWNLESALKGGEAALNTYRVVVN